MKIHGVTQTMKINAPDNARRCLETLRAIASNQLAGAWPRLYMRLAKQTGRGGESATAEETADYFMLCYNEMAERLGIPSHEMSAYLSGKDILEYGPGSIPGLAVLLLAAGARRVTCADRFPLLDDSAHGRAVLAALANRLEPAARAHALDLCRSITPRGIPGRLNVVLHPLGLSCIRNECDLVISRAVLEEVNNLEATFRDTASALRPGGIAVHQVDLRSYGLHQQHPLDFLVPAPRLWRLMYSNKCVPNRLRLGKYLEYAAQAGLRLMMLEREAILPHAQVDAIRPHLWRDFRDLPTEELACLTFWIVVQKPELPNLPNCACEQR